jgi:hypothetical protein
MDLYNYDHDYDVGNKLIEYINEINNIKVPEDYDYVKTGFNSLNYAQFYSSYIIYKHKEHLSSDRVIITYNCNTHNFDNIAILKSDSNKYIGNDINKIDLFDCKKKTYKFIDLTLFSNHGDRLHNHSNILIYNNHTRVLERFEPHGKTSPYGCDESINIAIKKQWPDIKYLAPSNICYSKGPQKNDIYCTIWSYLYLDIRLSHPAVTQKNIIAIMIIYTNEKTVRNFSYIMYREYMKHKKIIKNYITKYLPGPVETFSKELLEKTKEQRKNLGYGKPRSRSRSKKSRSKKSRSKKSRSKKPRSKKSKSNKSRSKKSRSKKLKSKLRRPR